MENPVVKCNVANCTYWAEGNNCNAEAILVEIDAHSKRDFKMEAGSEPYATALEKDRANSIAETCCYTFRPKS
ncbi:DUF1540 domain-containing protein [Halalkalibacterium ligniniphilum]|uniref:DUF1540 domain-containing protein n=1 Tax=Halalkalibacterium ligniniphilum TaxID=1134413 RepID=UPI0003671579|nr:DUF1540 domain-containing protein [Halalkalibacterium ligniniphilum]